MKTHRNNCERKRPWQSQSTQTFPQLTTNRNSKARKSLSFRQTNQKTKVKFLDTHTRHTNHISLLRWDYWWNTSKYKLSANGTGWTVFVLALIPHRLIHKLFVGLSLLHDKTRSLSRQICSLFHHQDIANIHSFSRQAQIFSCSLPLFAIRALTDLKN